MIPCFGEGAVYSKFGPRLVDRGRVAVYLDLDPGAVEPEGRDGDDGVARLRVHKADEFGGLKFAPRLWERGGGRVVRTSGAGQRVDQD